METTTTAGQRRKVLAFMIHLRKEYIAIQSEKGAVWCSACPVADEIARAERDIKAYYAELRTLEPEIH